VLLAVVRRSTDHRNKSREGVLRADNGLMTRQGSGSRHLTVAAKTLCAPVAFLPGAAGAWHDHATVHEARDPA
jgi:hypothetical protein